MPVTCLACLSTIDSSSRFCPSCGTALATADALTVARTTGVVPTSAAAQPVTMPDGRFVSGTLLAGRYRIVGLLGRGGMGEVYRADDLTLGQPVALKFIPPALSADPDRLARFRAEVSTARQVSHPNVCRVHDIGEAGGVTFLSMEYIDGEDLSVLLRRIGRLPQDKGIEIARQVCAGLAAAHGRGIVHGDLKPANVMIDGRGHARLMDFGLSTAVDARTCATGTDARAHAAGTPAYMAPEQFQGQPASVRSDIYALGLVLYEVFTGKPAFRGATVGELAAMHRDRTPSSVTDMVADLDPAIESTIERCLAKDPVMRPASALSVSAALPGGDPLAAAMARGETPSPELVAAAGSTGLVRPAIAVGGVALVVAALIVNLLLNASVHPVRLGPFVKSPEVLRNDASVIARAFGYTHAPFDTASGFAESRYYAELRKETTARQRAHLKQGQPAAFLFWYRESPRTLSVGTIGSFGRVTPDDPPMVVPGMIEVGLDTRGRLLRFRAVPSQQDRGAGPSPAPDWTVAFAKADLDPARFTPVAPRWTPPFYADTRAAWDGAHPERLDVPLHVEAAAAEGRPVYFELLGPWRQPARADAGAPRTSAWFPRVVVPLIFLGLMAAAALLTARNLHLGRSDRRGAFRIAGFSAIALGTASAIGGDLHPTANGIFGVVLQALADALPIGALTWIGYIALEPYVRRRWPRTLIAWSRLVGGRWRDPLVGRDILAGVAVAGLLQLPTTVMQVAGAVESTASYPIWILDGLRFTASWMSTQAASLVLIGIGMLFGFLLLALVVGRAWIAGVLVVAFFATAGFVQGVHAPTTAIAAAISIGVLVVCLLRFGLLLTVVTMWTGNLIGGAPLTLDPTVWYSPNAYLVMAAVVALAGFGAWTSANLGVAVRRLWRE